MGVDVSFRVIGFPNTSRNVPVEFQDRVKECLRRCGAHINSITYSSGIENKDYKGADSLKNIPRVIQEILLFNDVAATLTPEHGEEKYKIFTRFVRNWLEYSKGLFVPAHTPWFVVTDKQAFVPTHKFIYSQTFDHCTFSIGTLNSSSNFVIHQQLQGDVSFYHDVRDLKIRFSSLNKVLGLNYSNFRHVLVDGSRLLIVFTNPPIVRNLEETERLNSEPITRETLGKSNGILLELPKEGLNEVISRLNYGFLQHPIVFVPYQISTQNNPATKVDMTYLEKCVGFNCCYLIEGLIRQKFLLLLQDVNSFFASVIFMHSKNPDALEKALADLLLATEQSYPVNLETSLKIWFQHIVTTKQGDTLMSFVPSQTRLIRRVVITPTRVLLWPHEVIIENRVLRNFDPEFALRVSFRDDDYVKLNIRLPLDENIVHHAIRFPMRNGLTIAGRHYEFLAWSNSQIRDHSVWMYAKDNENRTAESIREWMGDFSKIKVVAKYMSRMGQCFSQTKDALGIPMDSKNIGIERDIERGFDPETGKSYCFSDGIGKISKDTALEVCETLGIPKKTSAFQIRYGGCKGMVVVDPALVDKKMIIRDSMNKFDSSSQRLEIVKYSQAGPVNLNRPMVAILDHLRVDPGVLLRIQEDALQTLTEMLFDSEKAADYLAHHNNLRGVDFADTHRCGIDLASEPFFRGMLLARHKYDVAGLLHKARLPIAPSDGRNMFGVLDETGLLQYGQVFVQYTIDIVGQETNRQTTILTDQVLITKNPCYLAGDVRMFKCVDVPALHHIVDCVVFPRQGYRPHANEMSGSDLDGDEYTVIWKKELFFKCNAPPGQFPSPSGQELKRQIRVSDMVSFLCDFITNDRIGFIASAHLAFSDAKGIECSESISLARYCSIAVDFPKTGRSVNVDKSLRPQRYPDFMERKYRERYRSRRTLGKLYRVCKDFQNASLPVSNPYTDVQVDEDLVYPGWEKYRDEAVKTLSSYRHFVLQLLSTYGVKHESEAMAGAFSTIHSRFQETKDRYETEELVAIYIKSLWKKYAQEFMEEFRIVNYNPSEDILKKASAWYVVTYEQKNPEVLSFAWIVTRHLAKIKLQQLSKRQKQVVPSPILERLNSELELCPLPGLSYDLLLKITSFQTNVFRKRNYETLIKSAIVLLNWARKVGLIFSTRLRGPREGFMPEKTLIDLIEQVVKREFQDRGVVPVILSFFKYCISFRFLTGAQKLQILPYAVRQSGFISKKAMLSYRDLAVSLDLATLGIGELSLESEIQMEPIHIQKTTVGYSVSSLQALLVKWSGVGNIEIRPFNRWQYIVNAFGRVDCIYELVDILKNGDEYLKSALLTRQLPKKPKGLWK